MEIPGGWREGQLLLNAAPSPTATIRLRHVSFNGKRSPKSWRGWKFQEVGERGNLYLVLHRNQPPESFCQAVSVEGAGFEITSY